MNNKLITIILMMIKLSIIKLLIQKVKDAFDKETSARQERERVSGNNVRTQTSERVVYTGRKGDRRKHLPVHTVPEASSGTAYSHV